MARQHYDITFDTQLDGEPCRFALRVRAIIISDGKILMNYNPKTGLYTSVGGRVHLNEISAEACLREVLEDTGIDMEIDRLGYVHENFYVSKVDGIQTHEIALFYYMKEVPGLWQKELRSPSGENLVWLELDKLSDYKVHPTFFKKRLLNPSDNIEHLFTLESEGMFL